MGELSVSGSNARYFERDGVALYMGGVNQIYNTDYGTTSPPPDRQTRNLTWLTDMEQYDPNLVRLWRWPEFPRYKVAVPDAWEYSQPQPWKRTGPGNGLDGLLKFDLTQFDPTYFARLQNNVVAANRRGITPYVMLFEGWMFEASAAADSWQSHPFNGSNNIQAVNADTNADGEGKEWHQCVSGCTWTSYQQAYLREVSDALNHLSVLYEVANEAEDGSLDWQEAMAIYLAAYEAANKPRQHPVGVSTTWTGSLAALLALDSSVAWVAPNLTSAYWTSPTELDGTKVVIADTDHTTQDRRTIGLPWRLFTRGHNINLYLSKPPDDPLEIPAQQVVRDIISYAARMDLAATVPQGLLSSTGYALAELGQKYLLWQPGTAAFTLDLTLESGTYSVEWFDATDHQVETGGTSTVSGGAERTLTLPGTITGGAVAFVERL